MRNRRDSEGVPTPKPRKTRTLRDGRVYPLRNVGNFEINILGWINPSQHVIKREINVKGWVNPPYHVETPENVEMDMSKWVNPPRHVKNIPVHSKDALIMQ